MKLIIDIPDDIYQYVMNTGTYGHYRFNSARAIRKGTPLDKIRDEIASCRTQDKGWDLNDKYLIAKAVEVIDRYRESEG